MLWSMLLWCLGHGFVIVQASGCSSNVTSECGQLCHTGTSGKLILPTNCDGKYCNNMICSYRVCPPSVTGSISIAFPRMDVESCNYDYVLINGTRICESFSQPRQYRRDRNGCLNMTFYSDGSAIHSGFTMEYSTQPVCPLNSVINAADVSLPTECGGRYCPNMNCYIGICPDSSPGYVTLTFSLFHVDDNETCSGDVLEVAGTAYCSLDSVPRVFPLDPHGCLNLTFRSDSSRQGLGFRFSYQAGVVVPSCPAVFTGPTGVVHFPPRPPGMDLNCSMQVCLGPKAHNVTLTARHWDLSCPDDFLETGGRRYCQASPQGEVLPLDGRGCLDLLLHRNTSTGGVRLLYSLYKPECGVGDVVADSGLLSVPTPCQGRYCDNLDCSYRVCPSSASRSLAFSLLMMDVVDSSCTGDYLTIGSPQNKYCSLVNVPPMSVDRWGCVSAGFHSDGQDEGRGFLLSYSTYSRECGVLHYSTDHDTITLPANCYGKYCPNLNCTYTVCPQSRSTHVQITLRMLHVVDANCTDNYLIIDETRICEFDPQPKHFPVDNKGCLSMTFRSNNVGRNYGFSLDYAALSPTDDDTTNGNELNVIIVASVLSLIIVVLVAVLTTVCILGRRRFSRDASAFPLNAVEKTSARQANAYVMQDMQQAAVENEDIYEAVDAQDEVYEPVDAEEIYENP